MQKSPNPSTTAQPLQLLYGQITELYTHWEPVLREVGISAERYQLPALANYHTLSRLKRVHHEFKWLVSSEAMMLFLRARALHPNGTLARWSADKTMRSARDVQVYITARSLCREAWYSNVALKSFFKVKVPVAKE